MIQRNSFYESLPSLSQSIEEMIMDSIVGHSRQDKRVLYHTDKYQIIGKLYREPSQKPLKPDRILFIATVKLIEPGYVNLQSPISKQEFTCKASRKKLKGKSFQQKLSYLVQSISLDISYALSTRRRNFSPEVIEEMLKRNDHFNE